ncbi:hypothetical protein LY78DRAFT_219547 [Colletotrichum sublineola]|nr:hypothetical protein LY78DRAFT_219547 [Colletotrichum sublineola]
MSCTYGEQWPFGFPFRVVRSWLLAWNMWIMLWAVFGLHRIVGAGLRKPRVPPGSTSQAQGSQMATERATRLFL